ncbi:MAG: hypothetical protein JW874_10105 [Spirochaetales bacterium]|nr:hypothetical protein [Spirochaetales bacterium]
MYKRIFLYIFCIVSVSCYSQENIKIEIENYFDSFFNMLKNKESSAETINKIVNSFVDTEENQKALKIILNRIYTKIEYKIIKAELVDGIYLVQLHVAQIYVDKAGKSEESYIKKFFMQKSNGNLIIIETDFAAPMPLMITLIIFGCFLVVLAIVAFFMGKGLVKLREKRRML